MYLNDLNDCFDISCDRVVIDTTKISSLLYTDDIVLLSNTAEGLQNALNKLGKFCETLNLKINISKTKVMVFNKSGNLLKGFSFTYMQMAIEIVQEYKYLGIIFKPSGVFSHAIKYLYNKALKATFCVRRAFKAESINTELYLTIYEHCVKPVLLYCSEIWSIDFLINKAEIAQRYDLLLPEKLQLRFLKSVMGVHKSANNNAVRSEFGIFPLALYGLKTRWIIGYVL